MISLIINMLITLIGVSALAGVGIYYWPKIQEMIEDQLASSLNRDTDAKSRRPLYKVFYKFNHPSSQAWISWIKGQDQETQDIGFAKLIQHLEGDPKEWGAVTVEVIRSVVEFEIDESFDVLEGFIETCDGLWQKYKTVGLCYGEACKGLATINAVKAKDILLGQLEISKQDNNEDMTMGIIEALSVFPEEVGVEEIFIKIISNPQNEPKVRVFATNAAKSRENEEEVKTILSGSIDRYSSDEFEKFEIEDSRIFKRLVTELSEYIVEDPEAWQTIIKAADAKHAQQCLIEVMSTILQDTNKDFSPEQLYLMFNIKSEYSIITREALSKRFALSSEENSIVNEIPVMDKYPFLKDVFCSEEAGEELIVPPGLDQKFADMSELLNKKAMPDEKGEKRTGGAALICGKASEEKLYLARAIASRKKWKFIYCDFSDLIVDAEDVQKFLKELRAAKKCLVFLDNVKPILGSPDDPSVQEIVKGLRQLVANPLFFMLGTLERSVQIKKDEDLPGNLISLPRDLFPFVHNMDECTDRQKRSLFDSYALKLAVNREQDQFPVDDLLGETLGFSVIEYISYLVKYMQTSLLIFGKLVDLQEVKDLSR